MDQKESRLLVVDALRGFAIVSIMLLHNIEHFDFMYWPENLPGWMVSLDKGIMDTMYFLFGGKSYAIFALLFGLTFFIQSDKQERLGKDFRARFAWRLVILLGFAIINSAFYEGDILSIYAVLGFCLIPVARLSNRAVFLIALLLMLQPIEWVNFFINMQNPDIPISPSKSGAYFDKIGEYLAKDSLIDALLGNLTNGKIAVVLWSWEKGRILQNIALFMFGMLAGRKLLFVQSEQSTRFWKKTLPIAVVSFFVLFTVHKQLSQWVTSPAMYRNINTIVSSYVNMAIMLIWVSGFVLLFQTKFFHKALNALSPMGKMSLSNYMIQSLIGSFIYYGFGLGLYKYTGSTYSILIGVVLAILQGLFSARWMKNHKQGPLESLWHKATWIGYK